MGRVETLEDEQGEGQFLGSGRAWPAPGTPHLASISGGTVGAAW
jgi:hypothetical protein